jgi:hypothetical protein
VAESFSDTPQDRELVIAVSPAQAGAVVALLIGLILIVRALRSGRSG